MGKYSKGKPANQGFLHAPHSQGPFNAGTRASRPNRHISPSCCSNTALGRPPRCVLAASGLDIAAHYLNAMQRADALQAGGQLGHACQRNRAVLLHRTRALLCCLCMWRQAPDVSTGMNTACISSTPQQAQIEHKAHANHEKTACLGQSAASVPTWVFHSLSGCMRRCKPWQLQEHRTACPSRLQVPNWHFYLERHALAHL